MTLLESDFKSSQTMNIWIRVSSKPIVDQGKELKSEVGPISSGVVHVQNSILFLATIVNLGTW